MSAVIIGSPSSIATAANAKVLRRQNFQREFNGIEALLETYIIQTANRASLTPAKDTVHSSFSTASTKYSRMVVERVSFSEQDGDLTEMNVSYVGLSSESGLPPAIVRILPVTDAGVFGPDINIEAEFVTDAQESQLVVGKFSSTAPAIPFQSFTKKQRMPSIINGVQMPNNPVQPFNKSRTVTPAPGSGSLFVRTVYDIYDGYVIKGIDCDRNGQFLVARITFQEFRFFRVL